MEGQRKGLANLWERSKLFWRVRKKRYDLVIDQTRGTTGAQITFFSGAKYRLGYANSRYKKVYNLLGFEGRQRYSGAMRFDLLAPLGIKEQKFNLHFAVKAGDRDYIKNWLKENNLLDKKLVILSPGSPVPRKMWKLEKYAKLCDLIVSQTLFSPILLWGPSELATVEKVQQLANEKVLLAPATNFSQAGALLEKAKILVCNDGGINHFSQAVGCPSLAIFTDNSETKNWSMQGVFERHWHITAENKEIEVEAVFEKLRKCLEQILDER